MVHQLFTARERSGWKKHCSRGEFAFQSIIENIPAIRAFNDARYMQLQKKIGIETNCEFMQCVF